MLQYLFFLLAECMCYSKRECTVHANAALKWLCTAGTVHRRHHN